MRARSRVRILDDSAVLYLWNNICIVVVQHTLTHTHIHGEISSISIDVNYAPNDGTSMFWEVGKETKQLRIRHFAWVFLVGLIMFGRNIVFNVAVKTVGSLRFGVVPIVRNRRLELNFHSPFWCILY